MFKSALLSLVALAFLAMGQAVPAGHDSLHRKEPKSVPAGDDGPSDPPQADHYSGPQSASTINILLKTFRTATARGEKVSLLLNSNKGETTAIFKLGTTTTTTGARRRRSATDTTTGSNTTTTTGDRRRRSISDSCCDFINVKGNGLNGMPSATYVKLPQEHNDRPVYQHGTWCIFQGKLGGASGGHWKIDGCDFVHQENGDWSQGIAWSSVTATCPGDIGLQWRYYSWTGGSDSGPIDQDLQVNCDNCCDSINVKGNGLNGMPSATYTKLPEKHNDRPVYQHGTWCIFQGKLGGASGGHWKIDGCNFVHQENGDWSQGIAWSSVTATCPGDIGLQWRYYSWTGGSDSGPIDQDLQVNCDNCAQDNEYIISGNNIIGGQSVQTKGATECALACAALPECQAWTLHKNSDLCWLKKSNHGTGSSGDWTWGPRGDCAE